MSQEFEKSEIHDNLEEDKEIEDFLDSLEEFMEEESIKELNIDEEKIATNSFVIQTKEQANFFIKQVLEAKAQMDEINSTANKMLESEKEKIDRWRNKELNRVQGTVDYITGLLQNFTEEELSKSNGKKKSVSLPNGSVGFRAQGDKYEYDDKTILEYLQDTGKKEFITYKPQVSHAELKKKGTVIDGQLYVDDEPVPGVTVTPQDPKFEVK